MQSREPKAYLTSQKISSQLEVNPLTACHNWPCYGRKGGRQNTRRGRAELYMPCSSQSAAGRTLAAENLVLSAERVSYKAQHACGRLVGRPGGLAAEANRLPPALQRPNKPAL